MSVVDDPWDDRMRPADDYELTAADDRTHRDLRDPDDFPNPQHQLRVAEARKPQPGKPLTRPGEKGGQS